MSSSRPFRFGLEVHSAASKEDWATKARRAEDSGYAILLLPDHLLRSWPVLLASKKLARMSQ